MKSVGSIERCGKLWMKRCRECFCNSGDDGDKRCEKFELDGNTARKRKNSFPSAVECTDRRMSPIVYNARAGQEQL